MNICYKPFSMLSIILSLILVGCASAPVEEPNVEDTYVNDVELDATTEEEVVQETVVEIETDTVFYFDFDNDTKKDLIIAPNGNNVSHNFENIWFYKNGCFINISF